MTSRPPLQLGVWQATAPSVLSGGIADAVQSITQALTHAKKAGVEILVFPECFLTGYFRPTEEVPAIAAQVNKTILEQLADLAKTIDIAFVLGSYALMEDAPIENAPIENTAKENTPIKNAPTENAPTENAPTENAPIKNTTKENTPVENAPVKNTPIKNTAKAVTNTAYVFLPDAQKPLAYHKRTLFGDWEKSTFQRGTKPLLFNHRNYTFAVLICYDIEFPELTREVAQRGADALLVPTALMEPEHWIADCFIPTRAIESGVTIAYANYTGKSQNLTFIGKSQIYTPSAQKKVIAPPNHHGLITANLEDLKPYTDYLDEIKIQNIKP